MSIYDEVMAQRSVIDGAEKKPLRITFSLDGYRKAIAEHNSFNYFSTPRGGSWTKYTGLDYKIEHSQEQDVLVHYQ